PCTERVGAAASFGRMLEVREPPRPPLRRLELQIRCREAPLPLVAVRKSQKGLQVLLHRHARAELVAGRRRLSRLHEGAPFLGEGAGPGRTRPARAGGSGEKERRRQRRSRAENRSRRPHEGSYYEYQG